MQKIKYLFKKIKNKNESFESLRGNGKAKIKDTILGLILTELAFSLMLFNPELRLLWLYTSILFACLYISLYLYFSTSRKAKISLVNIVLLLSSILTILLFSGLIIIAFLYNKLMNIINMRYISQCFELFLVQASNCLLAALSILFIVNEGNDPELYVFVYELIAFVAIYCSNRFYTWLFYCGQKNALIRYRINCNLKYLGEFIVAVFLLIRHMSDGYLETTLFIFVAISAISTIRQRALKFNKYSRHRKYLECILDDLEGCKKLLLECNPKDKINVMFCFENIEWLFLDNYNNKQIRRAISYLQKLIYIQSKDKIWHRRRYTNTKWLCVKITKAQNAIAKSLK